MLKLMLCLFQENTSYGVKTICIHPLMSHHCTSLRHIWHSYQEYHQRKFRICNHLMDNLTTDTTIQNWLEMLSAYSYLS
jgi:hypothetical protein